MRACADCEHYQPDEGGHPHRGFCTLMPVWEKVVVDHYCGQFKITEIASARRFQEAAGSALPKELMASSDEGAGEPTSKQSGRAGVKAGSKRATPRKRAR